MAHHYTSNTVEAMEYCNTCNKVTPHFVAGNRRGRCMNDHAKPREEKRTLAGVEQDHLFAPNPEQGKFVEIMACQYAELFGESLGISDREARVKVSQRKFLDRIDSFPPGDGPLWAYELAVEIDGQRKG